MSINQPIQETAYRSTEINQILISALDSVDPRISVKKVFKRKKNSLFINDQEIKLQHNNKIYVIGVGKAVLRMTLAVSEVLDELISEGVVITKHSDIKIESQLNKRIHVKMGSHPVPSEKSVEATSVMLEMLTKTTANDLVIGLISGGGSALMTYPFEDVGLTGLQNVTSLLLKSGATIEEMNTIRKHLDLVKGGGLIKYISPARSYHLILSDVLGDPLSMIASGPTSADPTTFEDCLDIINKYGINKQLDNNAIAFLRDGAADMNEETIKEGNTILKDHQNLIIGSLTIAANAACKQAISDGFDAKILTTSLRGEAREIGTKLACQLVEIVKNKKPSEKPICLIAGGETTVTVNGKGKGGRNQELALAAAQILRGINNCAIISFATDGEDGPTDAAGGYVTGETIGFGEKMNLDSQEYINNNDAYEYLNKVGGLIRTGPTGTNVNDLVLMFAF